MIAHLVKGLRILGERWWPAKWLAAGENLLDTVVRWLLVAGGAYALWVLVTGSWKVLGVAVLAVAVKALRAATKATKAAPAKPQPSSPDTVHEATQDTPESDFVPLVYQLLDGGPGVHLATLAAALGPGTTTADVRALAGQHGILVRPSVRDASRRVSPGLHRDDLPPLPDPLSEGPVAGDVAVVPAGQPTTTAATTPAPTTPTTRTIGGVRVTSIPDADNPHRTHVRTAPAPKRA